MAPQASIPVAATVLGTIGTILWCVQLVPQIWTNWRTKSTDGLPGSMMFLWALCGVPFGTYSVVQNFNLPIQVQPQCFMALCLASWAQTLVYSRRRRPWRPWAAALLGVGAAAVFAGVEAALVLTIRPVYDRGDDTPVLVVGIVASVLLAAGLLPPYGEIWKRRGRVIGINWVFLTMDWNGAFFSLMAVAQKICRSASVYATADGYNPPSIALEAGIFTSHIIWLLRTREIRKQAKAQGKTFDDIAAEHEERGIPFKFAERKSRKERGKQAAGEVDVEAGAVGVVSQVDGQPARVGSTAAGGPADESTSPEKGGERSGGEKGKSG
ncbi:hypothetical protein VPNG_09570 [Cytospora leucostoma]|uniref:PQ loop repeat protein n=1 Tax=Cytospora leucostoma TaxID=1230097 RepID=A0A423VQF7_9PEZI|nr:hypothetical protein VPNG_09570 [Cytospora leucostoma]